MAAWAPVSRQIRHFSSVPAVASTRASRSVRAIWIAAMPTPLVPPCTSSGLAMVEPAQPDHAVPGGEERLRQRRRPSTKSKPFGIGMHCTAGTLQNSA